MKVKNHTQTVKTGVTAMIPSAAKITPEVFVKMKDYAQAPDEEKAAKKEELIKALPKEVKKELAELGCETPLDTIDMTLQLSGFLFDIYMSGVVAPSAPLARKIFEKQLLDLADKLKDPEEFPFEGKFRDVVQEVMLDDSKWESSKIHVEIQVGEQKLAVPLIHRVAHMFPEVLEAATKIFMELESAKAAGPKADSQAN